MRGTLSITLSILIFSFLNVSAIQKDEQSYCDSLKKKALPSDTNRMLRPIPIELIVYKSVNDSDVVVIRSRCVVLCKYSESELLEMKKKSRSEDQWNSFYDDYLFYNEDVSMFLYERAMVKIEFDKKFIQFIMASGVKITIDRKKSAGKLFFFNPLTGVKQCDSSSFDRRKYVKF